MFVTKTEEKITMDKDVLSYMYERWEDSDITAHYKTYKHHQDIQPSIIKP